MRSIGQIVAQAWEDTWEDDRLRGERLQKTLHEWKRNPRNGQWKDYGPHWPTRWVQMRMHSWYREFVSLTP